MLITIIAGIMLWNIWSELFLAFERLDTIPLWEVSEEVSGEVIFKAITVWDLMITIAVIVITFLGARNIPGLLEIALLSQLPLAVGTNYAITTVFRYVIVITGSVIALQLLGAQWSKLQWLIAALSVGLGFGLQEIVANFVSGIVILFERPIRIGDTVTIGDQTGTVNRIRIRATTIIDLDRREIVIPNKTFITERLINWSLTDPIMRAIIRVGVAYGSDIELTEKTLLEIAASNTKVLDEPKPSVFFQAFGDSTLNFELRVFISGFSNLVPVSHELNTAIDHEFRKKNIEIAFPQRDIHFDGKPLEIKIIDRHDS